MHIYKTTNIINGKIYIGQEKGNDPKYLGSGKILTMAIKKYGFENFKKEILQECENQEELNKAEIFWINNSNCFPPHGYNISKGNFGGDNVTNNPNKEEIIRKLIKNLNHYDWNGKKHSEESKKKISESKKGKISKPAGWHHTEEYKKKRSQEQIGITYEQRYGIEKAKIIKQKLREKSTGRKIDRRDILGENNPSKRLDVRNKISEIKKQNDKIKIRCKYCNKEFTKPNYIKSHGEKCKNYKS